MALIQTAVIAVIMLLFGLFTRRLAHHGSTAHDRAPATIEVENLVFRYGNVTAVEDVSFSVAAGQQLTLLGPSGCGKTTTLRAVAGLEKPVSGIIRVGGRAVFDGSKGSMWRPSDAACRWCSSPTRSGRT